MIEEEGSLFKGEEGKSLQVKPTGDDDTKMKGVEKFGAKAKDTIKDLGKDVLTSVEDAATGFKNSIKDIFNGKQNNPNGQEFIVREKAIANRHKDAIKDILNDTFSGNLWDAGVSAINLANTGTKWKTIMDQHVDKDAYAFKYYYHYDPLYSDVDTNSNDQTNITEAPADEKQTTVAFLDLIEDPTILGYTMRINYENSPIFKGVNKVGNAERSCSEFIDAYASTYGEMRAGKKYLEEFTEGINKIFESPENQYTNKTYKDPLKKNHYINSVEGLDKLDNYFVDYTQEDITSTGQKTLSEHLTITLHEDVRMFTNRLAFLYRNLSWSYNMGKKLIPENLLRFNLYIKIADFRNFTRGKGNDDEDDENLRNVTREGYSRVVYELKDCEFYFDSSLNPSEIIQAGFAGGQPSLSQLKMKIKYRKVNRIFYSKMFDPKYAEFLIGDKFHQPSTDKTYNDLYAIGFLNTTKRKASTNNFEVTTSLDERIDRLKNKGLFTEDDDDSALSRFAKGIGNDAAKAGFSIVDEGLQKVKQDLNSATPFGGNLRDALAGSVNAKTKDLGDVHPDLQYFVINPSLDLHPETQTRNIIDNIDLHPDANNRIDVPNLTDVHPDLDKNIDAPVIDLHDELDQPIIEPTEDLHDTLNQAVIEPTEDLHDTLSQPIIEPEEDLHDDLDQTVIEPTEDLHDDLNQAVIEPTEDLHPTLNQNTIDPKEDLHSDGNGNITEPDNDLHPTLDQTIDEPDNDLHPTLDQTIDDPDNDLHPNGNGNITEPENDLHPNGDGKINEPDNDLHPDGNNNINDPENDLHPNNDNNIGEPDKDLHPNGNNNINDPNEKLQNSPFKKFIKKDPSQVNPLDKNRFKDNT